MAYRARQIECVLQGSRRREGTYYAAAAFRLRPRAARAPLHNAGAPLRASSHLLQQVLSHPAERFSRQQRCPGLPKNKSRAPGELYLGAAQLS